MPYSIEKRGGQWVVYNTQTGDVKGHFSSRAKAAKQFRLLEMIKHGGKPRNKKK